MLSETPLVNDIAMPRSDRLQWSTKYSHGVSEYIRLDQVIDVDAVWNAAGQQHSYAS